jgi:esterase/lipase superfamily enzyme
MDASQLIAPPTGEQHMPKDVVLFFHGYNYSGIDAILAGARLKSIIGNDTVTIVISWPSMAGIWGYLGYLHDEDEIDYSRPMMLSILTAVLQSPNFRRVQIVAHSLGGRALVGALSSLYSSSNDRHLLSRISEIVLAAPDLPQDVMDRDYLPMARDVGFDTSLYVSNRDLAMWISEIAHGRPRVGNSRNTIYLREGISTIEVSAVDKSRWGHSSIFESSRIANDIHYFLKFHVPAKERYGLKKSDGGYWYMQQ